MELYILDGLLRRTRVVDAFQSLIWTERWSEAGDFELELKSTLQNRGDFFVGARLAFNNSHRVMVVDTVEDKTDPEGAETLTIKGRSLEALLEDRVVRLAMTSLESESSWILTSTPGNIIRTMFDHICRAPAGLNPNDAIPFLQPGTIFPIGTIPEPPEVIEWEQKPESLYNAIKKICELYDLGFRIVRYFDASELYFDVYAGSDRTTQQSVLPPVVFAVGFDNVQDVTEFTSTQKSKNVAYVFSQLGSRIVYGDGVDSSVSGFDRRVLMVSTSIDEDHPDIQAALLQAGHEALQNHRGVSLFDGEINQYGEYKYGVDYDLGDLVEMRNKDNVVSYKRVTEQIFVSDENGERSYPTLSEGIFVDYNTWRSWGSDNTAWDDLTGEIWADI